MNGYETLDLIYNLFFATGLPALTWRHPVMWAIAGFFMYLAIAKKYEPQLLLPIGFGIFLVNFPLVPLMGVTESGYPELLRVFYHYGIEWELIPCIMFLGLGAMTDFGPLIANPKTMLIGAGAQFGIFITVIGTLLAGFTLKEAASVGVIGGADGPTTIYLTQHLAPHMLGANALAAYSYMAMVPLIQPPILRLFTTEEERKIRMRQLRPVTKEEKIMYPIVACLVIALLVPTVIPLMGMFLFGNLMKESGVVSRLANAAENDLINIVTIFLGISIGATMDGEKFLTAKPLFIFGLGLVSFACCTVGGILMVKILNFFVKEKINPLIGSAGVSAVPMAPRVSQMMGQLYDKKNHLLMHAMGPNLAGVIGTAAAAGMLLTMFE